MSAETDKALERIRKEQAELKRRLVSLEKKITAIEALPREEIPAAAVSTPISRRQPAPPPLPLLATEPVAPTEPGPRIARVARRESTPGKEEAVAPEAFASKFAAPPRAAVSEGFEMKLGKYWLVRIGIVMLLTGMVLLANHYLFSDRIGPGIKLCGLYIVSFALLGAGIWIERARETLRSYGQVLAAGGLAAVYFTTYGAHHIAALKVISSPYLAGALLLIWAGFMVALAEWRKSQNLAVMGVLLAYYTSLITRATEFSLWSSLILGVMALVFIVRNRWMVVGFVSLAGTYLAFAYWRYPHFVAWLQHHPPDSGSFWPAYGFLICYWAIFTAAAFLSSREHVSVARRSTLAGINSGAFLALFGLGMARHFPDQFWLFALISGAVFLALFEVAERRFERGNLLSNIFLTKGVVLLTLAFLIKLNGVSLALILGAESSVLLVFAMRRNNLALEAGASICAIFATLYTAICELTGPGRIAFVEYTGDLPGPAVLGQALFLFFNAWWTRARAGRGPGTEPTALEPAACLYISLGITVAAVGLLYDIAPDYRPLAFLAAGLITAAAGTYRRLGLRELALLGQAFSLLGIVSFLKSHAESSHAPVLWTCVLTLTGILGLTHWSRHERGLPAGKSVRRFFEFLFSGGLTLSLAVFPLNRLPDERAWLYLAGLMALAQLLYGIKTRLPVLAALSQSYHFIAFFAFFAWRDDIFLSAQPIGLLIANLLVIGALKPSAERAGFLTARREKGFEAYLFVLRSMALTMFLVWIHLHMPDPWQPLAAGAAAAGLFTLAVRQSDGQRLLFALFLLGTGSLRLFIDVLEAGGSGPWQWYPACLIPAGMQQILRHLRPSSLPDPLSITAGEPLHAPILRRDSFLTGFHATLITLGVALLWLVVSMDVHSWRDGFYLTVSWSLLAVAVFGAGWILRERLYRLLGLSILGAALVRVLSVDVWALDQVARIVSFIVIGLVLLSLGFVYTRFQEKLRRYL